MQITRRDFLKICGVSAAALGLSGTDLLRLEQALAAPDAPTVLWLSGSSCTGCSISFLNYISSSDPSDAGDILLNHIDLAYHPNLMTAAGQTAAQAAYDVYNKGGYVLAVEGGVPTAFGGRACWAWTYNDGVTTKEETFQEVITKFAGKAAAILSIGTCASWGGIPASGVNIVNPTQVKGVSAVTGKTTINIAGCPPHPDWVVWTIVQFLLGNTISRDSAGRPTTLFGQTVHSQCPRNHDSERCLAPQGCRGPGTHANCPTNLWNNWTNWCIDANAPCYACTEPAFPGTASLYSVMYNPHGGTDLNCSRCHDDDDHHGEYDD
jgi:hydrogenase small subunit